MPRLFTGLEIPLQAAAAIASTRGGLAGARWIEPDLYHLTLRFIGDVDAATARDVAAELENVRGAPLVVTLDGFAVFGGARPRALVVAAQPSTELLTLQADNERAMRRIGLPPETRKFAPHVTLARLRQTSSAAVASFMESRGGFRQAFEVSRFALFSAREKTGGGPYVVEAAYRLD